MTSLNPWLFRTWLHSLDTDEPAGDRCHPWGCPVANWLYEATGGETCISIDEEQCFVGTWQGRSPLWLILFVLAIDDGPGFEASKDEALATLNHAERLAAQYLLPQRAESLLVARGMELRGGHFTRAVRPPWGLPHRLTHRTYEELQEDLWRLSPPVTVGQLREDYPKIFGGEK